MSTGEEDDGFIVAYAFIYTSGKPPAVIFRKRCIDECVVYLETLAS